MKDCLIEISQNADRLQLRIDAPTGLKLVDRPVPDIDPSDLDALRGGAAAAHVVEEVTRRLSEWLATGEPDLDLPLVLELANAEAEPLRLVYSMLSVQDERIREKLTDLPFELIAPVDRLDDPLVTHQRIGSVVYWLPKAGSPAVVGAGSWPLRVLVVRANPKALQKVGQVPSAIEIRDAIREANATLGADLLQIDVLSREDGPEIAGLPTKEQLFDQVRAGAGYHILVYLGHGDVRQAHSDEPPMGLLQLETEDGEHFDDLDASQLSSLLNQKPVPVVLLVGCLTAAEGLSGPQLAAITNEVPSWMRGSRAVAQGLIDGQSGVQFVVGMRFRITVGAAKRFLKTFFLSLLAAKEDGEPDALRLGDLEQAVRRARLKLRVVEPDLSWAAPLIFRTRGAEPTFPFLATPPTADCPELTQEKIRAEFWRVLAEVPSAMRSEAPDSWYMRFKATMRTNKQELVAARTAHGGALLMPGLKEVAPEELAPTETIVRVAVELHGTVDAHSLEGRLSVTGTEPSRVLPIDSSAAASLRDQGWRLMSEPPVGSQLAFTLTRTEPGNGPLPTESLFEVAIAIPSTPARVHTVTLDHVKTTPRRAICGGSNAIIVSL